MGANGLTITGNNLNVRKEPNGEIIGQLNKGDRIVTCECPFTGVVSDEIILQPLMDFMRSPDTRNFKELMRDCLENFFRSCRDDCEYCESEEYFTDESHRNNWEYLIDGTLFKETA